MGGGDVVSKAANGSLAIPLIGDALGLANWGCELVVGLPLLIGTTSGMTCCCGGGGENTAPTTGGDTGDSVEGNCWCDRDSACVLPE